VAFVTRERLLTQIFGALDEADRGTLLRLLNQLDQAIEAPAEPASVPA
jgi:hypothetical protein